MYKGKFPQKALKVFRRLIDIMDSGPMSSRKEPKVRHIDSDLYLGARKEPKVIDIWTVTSS